MQSDLMIRMIVRLIFSGLIALPFLWASSLTEVGSGWGMAVQAMVVVSAISPLIPTLRWRWLFWPLAIVLPPLLNPAVPPVLLATFLLTAVLLLTLTWLYQRSDAAIKVALVFGSMIVSLLLLDFGAGILLRRIEAPTIAELPSPTPPPTEAVTAAPSNTPEPTDTPDPDITPSPSPTPEPERPVAWAAQIDWLQDGGEPDYVQFTGSAPRINSTGHAYQYDENGELVYDHIITFNSQGSRGPEISYDKPDDVFRILLIGDSFVEAVQVDYAKTFAALLQDQLNTLNTRRRFEVVSIGRTGWGTLQELLYYQHEGYRFQADLVILSFYINDVADNFPRFFYPDINNTNYDYVFEEDTVTLIDTNQQPLPPNVPRKLYNGLPDFVQRSNLARLTIRLLDPPTPTLTPGGVLTRVHPQWYIYVTEPEVEGYAEAWERTARGLDMLARHVHADGGILAVMPIFVGAEMVQNISGWFPEQTAGWQWDDSLPETRLAEILADSPADLIETRPAYEAYADNADSTVYDLLYLRGDGHFNATGHEVTAQVLFDWLLDEGINSGER